MIHRLVPPRLHGRIAASIAATDTESCVAALKTLAPGVAAAEIRLDLMRSFSVPDIVEQSPVSLIMTCRPTWEGGQFGGSEQQRLAVLRDAYESGAAYLDVEARSVGEVAAWAHPSRLIVSRHWYDRMPEDLVAEYRQLRDRAGAVKLVGYALAPTDVGPVLELLRSATTPVIALAMGDYGQLTRLIAATFPACLLTYGIPDGAPTTAGGQLTLGEMIDHYHLDAVTERTNVTVHLCTTSQQVDAVRARQEAAEPGADLHLPVTVPAAERNSVARVLRRVLPPAYAIAA